MPLYRYRAKKGPDKTVEDVIEAENRDRAVELLTAMGLTPVRVETGADSITLTDIGRGFQGRISRRDISLFTFQMSRLLRTGISILKALVVLSEQSENRNVRAVIAAIVQDIKGGRSFSEALSKFPRVFNRLYTGLVKAAEESGTLPAVLERLAGYLQSQEEFSAKLRLAFVYPVFVACAGLATFVFMLVAVIPRIKQVYSMTGQELPAMTMSLICFSEWFLRYWVVAALAVAAGIGIAVYASRRNSAGVSAMKLRLPLYGKFVLKSEIARLASSLGLSLKNGIQILRALELCLPVAGNVIIRQELKKVYEKVRQGESFGKNMRTSSLFPPFVSNLIIVGEESGKLDEMLEEVADYYQKDTEASLKMLTTIMEPALILVVGAVLGYVVIAMLLPIFQINLIAS